MGNLSFLRVFGTLKEWPNIVLIQSVFISFFGRIKSPSGGAFAWGLEGWWKAGGSKAGVSQSAAQCLVVLWLHTWTEVEVYQAECLFFLCLVSGCVCRVITRVTPQGGGLCATYGCIWPPV